MLKVQKNAIEWHERLFMFCLDAILKWNRYQHLLSVPRVAWKVSSFNTFRVYVTSFFVFKIIFNHTICTVNTFVICHKHFSFHNYNIK